MRTGGYVIDFWGAGFEIAERMGLLPEIRSKGYVVEEVRVVGRDGKRVTGFPANAFSRMTKGRFVSLARGDLAATIFRALAGTVETIFGDSVKRIEQTERSVRVELERGGKREFDLVVGADGLHSRVRQIVFGEEGQFEKYLGYKAAAFGVRGYQPRDELIYVMFTEVGQQVVRFAMRDDRTMFLLTFRDENPAGADDAEAQKSLLKKRFGASGWECAKILEALDGCEDFYFDRVSQIRMDAAQQGKWTRGRVALLGDAASCVSLLAGQGSALAMVAAYILAGELKRAGGNYLEALGRYEELFGPFVRKKQEATLRFADMFAPGSRFALFARNQIFSLMRIPWIADMAFGRDMADAIALEEY